jgi:hypothetical protein
METNPPTMLEVVVLRSRPHSFITACSYDHAVALANSIGDDAIDPARVPTRDDLRWCLHCGHCGVRVLEAAGVCMQHSPSKCPKRRLPETCLNGGAVRHLFATYCDQESVPREWHGKLADLLTDDFDKWLEAGPEALGDTVAVWAGLTPEDPF